MFREQRKSEFYIENIPNQGECLSTGVEHGRERVFGVKFTLTMGNHGEPVVEIFYDHRVFDEIPMESGIPIPCWTPLPLFSRCRTLSTVEGFTGLVRSLLKQLKNEPEEFKEAAVRWLCREFYQYKGSQGIKELVGTRAVPLKYLSVILPKLCEYWEKDKGLQEDLFGLYLNYPDAFPQGLISKLLDDCHEQAMCAEDLGSKVKWFYHIYMLGRRTSQGEGFQSVISRYFGEYIGMEGCRKGLPELDEITPKDLMLYFSSLGKDSLVEGLDPNSLDFIVELGSRLRMNRDVEIETSGKFTAEVMSRREESKSGGVTKSST